MEKDRRRSAEALSDPRLTAEGISFTDDLGELKLEELDNDNVVEGDDERTRLDNRRPGMTEQQ
jgi:hypothetical protein